MKILLIPDSFKGSLSSARLCAIMKKAALDVMPDAQVTSIPAADGGEGTLDVIRNSIGGSFVVHSVTGPCGQPVSARYLSAGVVAFLNGRLLSGSDALLDLMNFSALAADADLIVTGEGMVDDQTAGGKLVSAVAARANGTPVVVLAGGIAEGTNLEALYEKGVTAVMPVTSRPMTLGEAMSGGAEGVRLTATQLFRLAGALKA